MIRLAWVLIVLGAAAVVLGAVRDELVWQFVGAGASVASLVAVAVLAARTYRSGRSGRSAVGETRAGPGPGPAHPPSPDDVSG